MRSHSDPDFIGPFQLQTNGVLSPHNVYVLFFENFFSLVFEDSKDNSINKFSMISSYLNVKGINFGIKNSVVSLSSEPFWVNLKKPDFPKFQKSGYISLSFVSDKKTNYYFWEIISQHCYHLLLVQPLALPSMKNILKNETFPLVFSSPVLNEKLLSHFYEHSLEMLSETSIGTVFAESFDFIIDFSNILLAGEAVDPIYSLFSLSVFNFSSSINMFFCKNLCFSVNSECSVLKDGLLESFCSSSFPSVYIFRGATLLPNFSLLEAKDILFEFLKMGIWQKMEVQKLHGHLGMWMIQMFGRQIWTIPAISFEYHSKDIYILSFNSLKPSQFIGRMRCEQKGSKFTKGIGDYWLPDLYYLVFIIEQKGSDLIMKFYEAISWDFDPEINGQTIENLSKSRSICLAHISSIISHYSLKKQIQKLNGVN